MRAKCAVWAFTLVLLILPAGCAGESAVKTAPSPSGPAKAEPPTRKNVAPLKDSAAEKQVTLAYRPTRGTVRQYRIRTTMTSDGMVNGHKLKVRVAQEMRLTEKTVSVRANGSSVVNLTYQYISGTANGKAFAPTPPKKSLSALLSPSGQVKEIRPLGGSAPQGGRDYADSFGDMPPEVPARPIAVGESWATKGTVSLADGRGTIGVSATYKLKGVKSSRGRRTALIDCVFSLPSTMSMTDPRFILESKSDVHGRARGEIAVENGTMVDSRMKATIDVRGMFHISGYGLPFVNTTQRIKLDQQITLVKGSQMAGLTTPALASFASS